MKTPDVQTEDWCLDNYMGKEVFVVIDEKRQIKAKLLDTTAKGIFVRLLTPYAAQAANTTCFFNYESFEFLALPALTPPAPIKKEATT
jgi:hypothetical protein